MGARRQHAPSSRLPASGESHAETPNIQANIQNPAAAPKTAAPMLPTFGAEVPSLQLHAPSPLVDVPNIPAERRSFGLEATTFGFGDGYIDTALPNRGEHL